jgi:KDO2-lipid IV(A) lauroyltransferase
MNPKAPTNGGCAIDTIEIPRVEALLREATPESLEKLFTPRELDDAGHGPGRAASLAARFAAKEACCKLFPRATALGLIGPADFSIRRDGYGAPQVEFSPNAQEVLDRHRIAGISVSLTHTSASASAIARAESRQTDVPLLGKIIYHLVPWRRGVVLGNLRLVFGDVLSERELIRLAHAYYAHLARFLVELVRLPLMSPKQRKAWCRVENMEVPISAHKKGKGLLLLVGHLGNWEVSTVAGISQFPQHRNLFHFVRRPLKPGWLNHFVTARTRRMGFGTLPKRGSLDRILDLLGNGAIIVFVFDQHAGPRDGIPVDFLGHPASTFKSLAILALNTGAPVIPACTWREPDGTHILRFENPVPLIECEDIGEAIRLNTRSYNAALERMLLRHPEQWIWMHRRWKPGAARKTSVPTAASSN